MTPEAATVSRRRAAAAAYVRLAKRWNQDVPPDIQAIADGRPWPTPQPGAQSPAAPAAPSPEPTTRTDR